MRVIVINPWDQSVTEAKHTGNYKDFYRLLSGPTLEGLPDAEINCFDIAQIGDPSGHIMFVDDEGLYGDPQAYFTLGADGNVFAGRGVIACGGHGEDDRIDAQGGRLRAMQEAGHAKQPHGDEPGKQQRERDLDALRRRFNEIPDEIARESEHIRSRFANPSVRLFPVAVTWLIPRRAVHAVAGGRA